MRLRMAAKLKTVSGHLQSKSDEIDSIYSEGVINGFTKGF